MNNKIEKELYYRVSNANGFLVFARPRDAENVSKIYEALQAKTWKQFREKMPPEDYLSVIDAIFANTEELSLVPADNDLFDATIIPGYLDGDYPLWLQSVMENVIPKEIIEMYGRRVATRLNGSYVEFDISDENEIIKNLRKLDFKVVRRDDLMFW